MLDWDPAIRDFNAVLVEEPANTDARREIEQISASRNAHATKEKAMYANMFGGK
jgi:hypothetical protein